METINEKVRRIISETLNIDLTKLNRHSNLITDFGVDSLDIVELIVVLEKEFAVEIPDEKLDQMKAVWHFTDYIEELKLKGTYTAQAA